jgi:hypothetical protein
VAGKRADSRLEQDDIGRAGRDALAGFEALQRDEIVTGPGADFNISPAMVHECDLTRDGLLPAPKLTWSLLAPIASGLDQLAHLSSSSASAPTIFLGDSPDSLAKR